MSRVVGKGFAVLQSGKVKLSGFMAWLAWAAIHIQYLAQANLRVSVFLQWVWTYVTGKRGSALIVTPYVPTMARRIPAPTPVSSNGSPRPIDAGSLLAGASNDH